MESFVYQYAVEAVVFGIGVWAGIRTGVLAPSHPAGRRRLLLLTAGLLFVFALQGAFYLLEAGS